VQGDRPSSWPPSSPPSVSAHSACRTRLGPPSGRAGRRAGNRGRGRRRRGARRTMGGTTSSSSSRRCSAVNSSSSMPASPAGTTSITSRSPSRWQRVAATAGVAAVEADGHAGSPRAPAPAAGRPETAANSGWRGFGLLLR
jgi:hypothetical protein